MGHSFPTLLEGTHERSPPVRCLTSPRIQSARSGNPPLQLTCTYRQTERILILIGELAGVIESYVNWRCLPSATGPEAADGAVPDQPGCKRLQGRTEDKPLGGVISTYLRAVCGVGG